MSQTRRAAPITVLYAGNRAQHFSQTLERAGCALHLTEAAELASMTWPIPQSDACLLDIDHLDIGDCLPALQRIASTMPVVLLTGAAGSLQQDLCQRIGATALLPNNVDAQALTASLQLWVERDHEMKVLRDSASRLQNALVSARCVSHAVGVLAERHQLPIDKAFQLLRSHARDARKRVVDLAREVVPQSSFS